MRSQTLIIITLTISTLSFSSYGKSLSSSPLFEQDLTEVSNNSSYVITLTQKNVSNMEPLRITDILKTIPGMIVSNPFGSKAIGSYLSGDEFPRRVSIYINDVPVNLASTGSVSWETLPLTVEDIKRITFRPTPGLEYGAITGILKIYTSNPDVATGKITALVNDHNETSIYTRVPISTKSIKGLISYKEVNDNHGILTKQSDLLSKKIKGYFLYRKNNSSFTFNIAYGESVSDVNPGKDTKQYPAYKDRKAKNLLADASWETVTNRNKFKIDIGTNKYWFDVNNELSKIPNYWSASPSSLTPVFDISFDSFRYVANITNLYIVNNNTSIKSGINYIKDEETPNKFSKSEKHWNSDISIFHSAIKYKKGQYDWEAGLGWTKHSNNDAKVSGFLKGGCFFKKANYIGASLSQSYRYPVNWENYSNHYIYFKENENLFLQRDIAPGNIKPEKNRSISIIYKYKTINELIVARIFNDYLSDMITYSFQQVPVGTGAKPYNGVPLSAVNTSLNNDSLNIFGQEFRLDTHLARNMHASISYSHRTADRNKRNIMIRSENIPEHTYSATLNYDIDNSLRIGAILYGFSRVTFESTDSIDELKKNNGYQDLSIFVRKFISVRDYQDLKFTLKAENLIPNQESFYNTKNTFEETVINATISFEF